MRVRKQKRNRKSVRFYAACFGFREPYKVLCDGTFVHHLVAQGMAPADDAVAKMLGGRCLLFSTSCVYGELGTLGKEYAGTLRAAKELVTARCGHDKRVRVESCIQAVVDGGNPEHFFVATQHPELRERLRQLPGVPVIFARKNTLLLEKPSSGERKFVKSTEEKRLHISELEAKMLGKRKMRGASLQATAEHDKGGDGLEDGLGAEQASTVKKRRLPKNDLGDKWQFKRKMAKGPNPLSRKKKSAKGTPGSSQIQDTGNESNAAKRKRNRKRHRIKNGSKVMDAGNQI